MNIHGLQKMTLLDFPGKVACTVFLAGCDFRCPFCHNSQLIDGTAPVEMNETGLLAFLKTRKGLLDGVAFTGGEPMLRKDLPQLLEKIRSMGFATKVDTNGNNPDLLRGIIDAGLADYIAMDVKNSQEKYGITIGLPDFDISKVSRSIEILREGKINYEFRTTVIDEYHDEESFVKIGEWIDGAEAYYLQCFTDRDTVIERNLTAPSEEKLRRYAEIVAPHVRKAELRGV